MGMFIGYMMQVSLVMAMLFVCYKALLSSATFHAFKRFTLLGVIAASWLLPLAMPIDSLPQNRDEELYILFDRNPPEAKGQGDVEIGQPLNVDVVRSDNLAPTHTRGLGWIIPLVYMCGVACMLAYTLMSVIRLAGVIRGGDKRRWHGFTMVVNDRAAGPFSWGRYVVVRRQDCDEDLSLVMTHELSHLRRRHWIDTLLAQLNVMLLWFNPFSYMIMGELKRIHEFEVDRDIAPAQTRRYQLMLIKKTVGSSFPTFANSLNHSQINIRITMMMKRKSSSARRLAALALPGAAALAMLAMSEPTVAHILADVSETSLTSLPERKVSQNSADEQIIEAVEAVNEAPERVRPAKSAESRAIVITGDEMVMETEAEGTTRAADESAVQEKADESPAYFVDGKLYKGKINDLDPSDIKSMSVVKNDPDYPNGKIMIEMMSEADKVALAAEHTAEFKGGSEALRNFLSDNVVCPKGLKGKVRSIVQFTVGTDGSVSDFKVMRSGGEAADAEAIRALSQTSHMWDPATTNGKPVASKYVIPITFTPK